MRGNFFLKIQFAWERVAWNKPPSSQDDCSGTPPYGYLVITAISFCPAHTFSYKRTPWMRPLRWYGQRPHSEIPTCIILYNFTPFIWPFKPVMFIFLLLIVCVLFEVSRGGEGARRTFQGLTKWFWYLSGCSTSKGPQLELLQYLLQYWATKMTGNMLF